MNYTENNQETTEKPWLPRDYPPAQLKRSEREPSKGHCGPRWYGAAGKHNSWCSIFRRASPESISLEDNVVNNIIDSVYSEDVKWVRWCITHPSTPQLSPVNELTEGQKMWSFTLYPSKSLRTSQWQRQSKMATAEWMHVCTYFIISIIIISDTNPKLFNIQRARKTLKNQNFTKSGTRVQQLKSESISYSYWWISCRL